MIESITQVSEEASKIIYAGELIRIGQFRRKTTHPNFEGPHINGGTLIVFPRTSVTITHAGRKPVVADPNNVMFYNHGQIYSRGKLSEKGDRCEWFGFGAELVADAIRPFDQDVDDHPCQPFQFTHGPSDTTCYLLQRLVVNHILQNERPDTLFIEEMALFILRQIIGNSYRQHQIPLQNAKAFHERDLANAIQKILTTRFEQDISLEQIAMQINYSPFHLCRIFHKHTGRSIHQYLKQLRLRTSLEYVTQANTNLTNLALKLGFSSHSHFTEAFRKTFGTPPSGMRNTSSRHMHELMSKISIA